MKHNRVVVGMSGASGQIYGITLMQELKKQGVEIHLVISGSARKTIELETDHKVEQVERYADYLYQEEEIGASISSGSFHHRGMVVVPCSIKTLSGIANSYNENLLIRAADVTLKERRPLILVVRETPLHRGHLGLLLKASEAGATIMPPVPAFYNRPTTLSDIVNHTVGRIMDHLGLENTLIREWRG